MACKKTRTADENEREDHRGKVFAVVSVVIEMRTKND